MYKLSEVDHPDMIVCKQRGNCEIIFEDDHGILMYNKNNKFAMADATSMDSAKKIVSCIDKQIDEVVIRGTYLHDQMHTSEKYSLDKGYYFVTLKNDLIKKNHEDISHRLLDSSFVHEVCKHYTYKVLANPAYISQVIEEGMIGAFHQDELIGYIGIHDTGSIGLLEVFPAYRHHGVAQTLLAEMIKFRKQQGLLPFGEVFEDNRASRCFMEKHGYQLNHKLSYWCTKR